MKSAKRRRGRDTKKELLLLIRDHISARARALALEMGPDQSYTSSSWPNLEKSGYLHIACSLQCHFPHLEGLTKKLQNSCTCAKFIGGTSLSHSIAAVFVFICGKKKSSQKCTSTPQQQKCLHCFPIPFFLYLVAP